MPSVSYARTRYAGDLPDSFRPCTSEHQRTEIKLANRSQARELILFVIVTGCCFVAFQNPIGSTIQTASRRAFRKDLTRAESPTKPAKRVPVSTGVWCRCSHLASISDVGHRRPSVGELWPRIEGNHSAPCVKVLWRLLVRRALTYRFSAA